MLHICSNLDSDCTWERSGRFATEEMCVAAGVESEAAKGKFKCVMQAQQEPPMGVQPLPEDQSR